ncbi:MAG: LssY C-terminal domain-containing protein [Patescibacteria group bacterium]
MALKFVKSIIKSASKGVAYDPEVQKVVARFTRFFGFVKKRLTPDEKFGLILTLGATAALFFIFLFFDICFNLIGNDPLVAADLRIINLIQIFRDPALNKIMLFVTYLGNWQVILLGLIFVCSYLAMVKRFYYLLALTFSTGGAVIFGEAVKYIFARPRPALINTLVAADGFSFPSGHMFIALAFYGLIAYFIFHRQKNYWLKFFAVLISALLVLAIGFSRVYLGVHWPSDVLASLVAGLALLAVSITALEMRRKFSHRTRGTFLFTSQTRLIANCLMFLIWSGFVIYFFNIHPLLVNQKLPLEQKVILNATDIPDDLFSRLPKTSETIVGTPMEPINIIIVGKKEDLQQNFIKAGWFQTDPLTPRTLWRLTKASILDQPYEQAPGTPTFWDTRPNDFSFAQETTERSVRERHHIHFWETPFVLPDGRSVWFATAHFDKNIQLAKNIFPAHVIDPAIDKERDKIKSDLRATGQVELVREFKIVEPTLGKNQAGDAFFTDGKTEIIFLAVQPKK